MNVYVFIAFVSVTAWNAWQSAANVLIKRDTVKHFDYPELRRSINLSLNPCDDFYEFVCDGFDRENTIKDKQLMVSQQYLIYNKIKENINELFRDRETMKEISPYDRVMYHIYDACMDDDARRADGSRIVIDKLRWMYSISTTLTSLTDWMIALFPIKLFYYNEVVSDIALRNQIISITIKDLILGDKKYYIDKNYAHVIDIYRQFLRNVLTIIADDNRKTNNTLPFVLNATTIEERVETLISFETKHAKMNELIYDDEITIADFQKSMTSTIDWQRYLNRVLPENVLNNLTSANKTVGDMKIQLSYNLKEYDNLIRSVSYKKLQHLMDWAIIFHYKMYLDDRFQNVSFGLNKLIYGYEIARTKENACRSIVFNMFNPFFNRLYLKKYYNQTAVMPKVLEMGNNIVSSFRDMLNNNTWMDSSTRNEALNKLALLDYMIGTPPNFYAKNLSEIYEGLDIDAVLGSNYADAVDLIWNAYDCALFGRLILPYRISFDVIRVNAVYYSNFNVIIVPSAILRGSYFDVNRSPALNYGSLGTILGHELTHGFDDNGRKFDSSGIIRNWWGAKAERYFTDRSKCFIDQYNKVNISGTTLHVDGKMTKDENIADNGGIHVAYLALQKHLAKAGAHAPPRIYGLEQFGAYQQFFLNFAFSFCSKEKAEFFALLANDHHAPSKVRVNVVLSNFKAFADAFSCPVGTPMNPNQKCILW